MRSCAVWAAGLVAMAAVSCSSGTSTSSNGTAPGDSASPATATVNNGPGNGFKLADCGGMSDAEVIAAVGNPMLVRDIDSPLGCRWSTGIGSSGTSISLYWYRGSAAAKEARVADNLGHTVTPVVTDGFPGFQVSNTGLCELSAGSGPDFLHWSLQTGRAGSDPCKAVGDLMKTLLGRVGKQ